MMFTYMIIASAFVIGMVLSGPVVDQMEISYENMEIQTLNETSTATTEMEQSESSSWSSNGSFERSSNLKYVMAIQKSSIWSDIKKRTLTISSKVNGEMIEKSPETMTDQELAQLKQACHDGLKCVAVDQLLVLKTIKQQSDSGNTMDVRTAITKITKVITEFTTEYHEDSYEYFEVTESDDPSKVYQSVTTIVEDNQELCKVNPKSSNDSVAYDGSTFNSDSSSSDRSLSNDSFSTDEDTIIAPTSAPGKQIFQNFGTVNNYNINQGTINDATVNVNPSDGKSNDGSKPETRDQGTNTDNTPDVIIKLGEENENKPSVNYHNNNILSQENNSQSNENLSNTLPQEDSSQANSLDYLNPETSVSPNTESSTPNTKISTDSSNISESDDSNPENALDYSLNVTNTNEGGCGDTNVDLAISGHSNQNEVRKGYVDKGNLNNGDMKVYNINKGIINDGTITKSNADNGVISIGTINKGPISYDYYNDYSTNNTDSTLTNVNVKQYLSDINKMYSAILEGLN